MKIRMTETYLIEADSIEELEKQYAEDHLESSNSFIDFESVKFEEVKEQKKMITLMPEQYGELVEKAVRFDILKAQAQEDKYLSDFDGTQVVESTDFIVCFRLVDVYTIEEKIARLEEENAKLNEAMNELLGV